MSEGFFGNGLFRKEVHSSSNQRFEEVLSLDHITLLTVSAGPYSPGLLHFQLKPTPFFADKNA